MNKTGTISIFCDILSNLSCDEEFEIKYRNKFRGFEPKRFIPSVDSTIFYDVLRNLNTSKWDITAHSNQRTVNETIKNLGTSDFFRNFRLHSKENFKGDKGGGSDSVVICKERKAIKQLKGGDGVFPQGFKMSLAKELQVDEKVSDEFIDLLKQTPFEYINRRRKHRFSFVEHFTCEKQGDDGKKTKHRLSVLRYDLTHVETSDGGGNNMGFSFEIELEYIGNQKKFCPDQDLVKVHIESISELFVNRMIWLLRQIQTTRALQTVSKHNEVYLYYVKLVGMHDEREKYGDHSRKDVFVGCQPESLHFRDLKTVFEQDYLIADKSDGERRLLIIFKDHLYLIDRFMHITKMGLSVPSELNGCLLDGEWFEEKSYFLTFDILYCFGKDQRGKDTADRISIAKKVISKMPSFPQNDGKVQFEIQMKAMVRWKPKVFLGSENYRNILGDILDCDDDSDGVILTPNTACPRTRKWPKLFKWKPKSQNSIDLFVEETNDKNVMALTIQTNVVFFNDNYYILFRKIKNSSTSGSSHIKSRKELVWLMDLKGVVIQIDPFNVPSKPIYQKSVCIPFPFQPFIDVSDGFDLRPNFVTEFVYDYDAKTLKPVKLRKDKSVKGYLGSNHLTVATDVWDSMMHPIELEVFYSLDSSKISQYYSIGFNQPNQILDSISSKFTLEIVEKEIIDDVTTRSISTDRKISRKKTKRSTTPKTQTASNSIWRMRKFHNYIKRFLIEQYCFNNNRLTIKQIFQKTRAKYDEESERYLFPNEERTRNYLTGLLGISNDDIGLHSKTHLYLDRDFVLFFQKLRMEKPKQNASVLDLCCGKGGDLWKYFDNDVDWLVGVDSEEYLLSIAEDSAVVRLKEISSSHSMSTTTAFVHADVRQNLYNIFLRKELHLDFDVVSCFFAIHYMFQNEYTLDAFLKNVKNMLSYNGYFIGTMVDGKSIYNEITSASQKGFVHKSKDGDLIYSVKFADPKQKKAYGLLDTFGTELLVELENSIISEYVDKQPQHKREFLVDFDKFIDIAKNYDLELVESIPFQEYYPDYNGPRLSNHEKRFSFIYRTFVFRKISNSKHFIDSSVYSKSKKLPSNFTYEAVDSKLKEIQDQQIEKLHIVSDLDFSEIPKSKDKKNSVSSGIDSISSNLSKIIDDSMDIVLKNSKKGRDKEVSYVDNESDSNRDNNDAQEEPKKKKCKIDQEDNNDQEEPKKKKRKTTKEKGCGNRCKKCTGCICVKNNRKCIDGLCGCPQNSCKNR